LTVLPWRVPSASQIQPGSWEEAYKAALSEADAARFKEHIRVAEGMLMARLLELSNSPEHKAEIQAAEDALRAERTLKKERLGL